MYHEIESSSRAICNTKTGYKRYVVTKDIFHEQIIRLSNQGFVGINVSQALSPCFTNVQTSPKIVITFDDGCESDLLIAAPLLKDHHFNATFYIVSDFIGRRGYLSPYQLKELSNLGFEIGSHSKTHRYLTDLNIKDLFFEVKESKDQLEQILGKTITHFSCPGGRYNPLVIQAVKEAGYQTMATSQIGVNCIKSNRFSLSRVSILRDIKHKDFDKLCIAEGFSRLQIRDFTYSIVKTIIGNSFYDKIRNMVLEASAFYKT